MSWSASAVGKPAAVAAKFAEDAGRSHCSEPEESIKRGVIGLVELALKAFPANSAVKVSANGCQNTSQDGLALNNLTLTIEPIHGFVE